MSSVVRMLANQIAEADVDWSDEFLQSGPPAPPPDALMELIKAESLKLRRMIAAVCWRITAALATFCGIVVLLSFGDLSDPTSDDIFRNWVWLGFMLIALIRTLASTAIILDLRRE